MLQLLYQSGLHQTHWVLPKPVGKELLQIRRSKMQITDNHIFSNYWNRRNHQSLLRKVNQWAVVKIYNLSPDEAAWDPKTRYLLIVGCSNDTWIKPKCSREYKFSQCKTTWSGMQISIMEHDVLFFVWPLTEGTCTCAQKGTFFYLCEFTILRTQSPHKIEDSLILNQICSHLH